MHAKTQLQKQSRYLAAVIWFNTMALLFWLRLLLMRLWRQIPTLNQIKRK